MSDTPGELDPKALYQLLEVIGGDRDALKELVQSFLDEGPDLVNRLRRAVEADDADALRRAAHTLKGSANDFGALTLARLCREIEAMGRASEVATAAGKVQEAAQEYQKAETGLKSILSA